MSFLNSIFGNLFGQPQYSIEAQFAEYVLQQYGGTAGIKISKPKQFAGKFHDLESQCIKEKGENFSVRIFRFATAGDQIQAESFHDMKAKIECYIWAGSCRYEQIMELMPPFLAKWEKDIPSEKVKYYKIYLVKAYDSTKHPEDALRINMSMLAGEPWSYHRIADMVSNYNQMGLPLKAEEVIATAKKTKYYKMTGLQYHMDDHERNYKRQKAWCESNSLTLSREQYFSKLVLPDPPINLYKKYVDRAELTIGAAVVSRRDREDYEWIQKNLPDICPKSFSGYKRMKTQNTKNFVKISEVCMSHGRDIQITDHYTEMAQCLSKIRAQEEADYWERRRAQENT